jgi:hypothetical protein
MARIDPVPGTPFGVSYQEVRPTVAGLAVGAMIAGIGSVMVDVLVYCFGLSGAQRGWGVAVSGAFAILSILLGAAGVGIGMISTRQVRRMPAELRGRGLAVTGIVCGASGIGLTALGFLLVVLVSA